MSDVFGVMVFNMLYTLRLLPPQISFAELNDNIIGSEKVGKWVKYH